MNEPPEEAPPQQETGVDIDLAGIVGENLRRLRTRRGLSLDRLAKACGVSRAMLGQIELGRSAPTINVLWKIVRALELPFAALLTENSSPGAATLLRKGEAKVLLSQDGRFSSRALFPFDLPRKVEFYELRLAARSSADSEAHAPGTMENLVVTRGQLEIETHQRIYRLEPGDAILFEADTPHIYRNPGPDEGVYYLVMTYVESVG